MRKQHSYIANGLGGRDGVLVVDLSNFKKITVDSSTGTAIIETGNRLGTIALELNKANRALPHGSCPYVGIGGLSGASSSPILLALLSWCCSRLRRIWILGTALGADHRHHKVYQHGHGEW